MKRCRILAICDMLPKGQSVEKNVGCKAVKLQIFGFHFATEQHSVLGWSTYQSDISCNG